MVRLDRFKAGADDFDDFMVAFGNEGRECRADSFLVVGYEHAHGHFCRTFRASAPIIAAGLLVMSGARTPSFFETR